MRNRNSQLSYSFRFQLQCSPPAGAQLHFVFLGAVIFTALEGICLIIASFSNDAPSMSLFYVVIGYSIALIPTVAGVAKFTDHYTAIEQLCILELDDGAGWLMLGPVIVSSSKINQFVEGTARSSGTSHEQKTFFENLRQCS